MLRCLTLIDEGTRECVALTVEASQPATRVIAALEGATKQYGRPHSLRTDNGPELVAKALEEWAQRQGIEHIFSQPGKPRQNGKNESFNGRETRKLKRSRLSPPPRRASRPGVRTR